METLRTFLLRCGVREDRLGDLSALDRLHGDLVEANRKTNLTRIVDEEGFWWRHVADSLSVGLVMPELLRESVTVADVGTGAGFPMLPLAWANPEICVTGIESRGRKAQFVRQEAARLGLSNCEFVALRAREVARLPEHGGRYDAVLLRAVGKAGAMVRECRALLREGEVASIVMYKTPDSVAREADEARREAGRYDLEIAVSETFSLPQGAGSRQFILARRRG